MRRLLFLFLLAAATGAAGCSDSSRFGRAIRSDYRTRDVFSPSGKVPPGHVQHDTGYNPASGKLHPQHDRGKDHGSKKGKPDKVKHKKGKGRK